MYLTCLSGAFDKPGASGEYSEEKKNSLIALESFLCVHNWERTFGVL